MFGKFSCAEGKGEEMDAALAGVVAAIEPWDGTESYSYHKGDDGTYWYFAQFANKEAMEGHGKTEAMQAALPPFWALLAEPPDISMTTPILADDLDA